MKHFAVLSVFFALNAIAADPVVGAKATYDYRRELNGEFDDVIMTKEVVSVNASRKTYDERITYADSNGRVLKQGVSRAQEFDLFMVSDPFFGAKCATSLNQQTVDGVHFSYEDVTVPMGTYKACELTYLVDSPDGAYKFTEYYVDDMPFNSVKTVIVDPLDGSVLTAVLKSIEMPK